jgi:succinoglycan biosynthesis protein ExoM
MTPEHHVTVCICTYKRPELLRCLLTKLEKQQTGGLFSIAVVIVDNDKLQSAYQTVSEYAIQSQISINYFVEPEQNIAMARNKTIENAKGDYVGFIDDDEFPENQWLLNLYKAIQHYKADGILGPVLPYFEISPPSWVLKGKFFERPTPATGRVLDWQNTRTGNALLKKDLFIKNNMWFDPSYSSGGEDRDFFRRMIAKGHTFIWYNEAPVFETVPPHRWDKKILIKRALLRGKMALNSVKSKPLSVIYSIAAIGIYSCFLPVSSIFGHHIFINYLIKTFDHIGKVAAFLGVNLIDEKYVGV